LNIERNGKDFQKTIKILQKYEQKINIFALAKTGKC